MTFNFKKYERHTDLLVYNLLNNDLDILLQQNWPEILYSLNFKSNQIKRIIGRSKISPDGVRTPQIFKIWSSVSGADHESSQGQDFSNLAVHKDNGITYQFDITKNMFSRGNINEKIRMGKVDLLDQEYSLGNFKTNDLFFADLYSGIGYFTLQILKSSLEKKSLKSALLFEWNSKAVEFLNLNIRENFKKNLKNLKILNFPGSDQESASQTQQTSTESEAKIPIKIFQGDNRIFPKSYGPKYKNSANRINLGLVPCSCGSFETAAFIAKLPCLMHVHHNVDRVKKSTNSSSAENSLTPLPDLFDKKCVVFGSKNPAEDIGRCIAEKIGSDLSSPSSYKLVKTTKVKSYGPNVDHLVYDILFF